MGEKEKEQIAQGYGARISLLERTHRLKISLFSSVRDYVRTHLLKEHRETFNEKYRKEPRSRTRRRSMSLITLACRC